MKRKSRTSSEDRDRRRAVPAVSRCLRRVLGISSADVALLGRVKSLWVRSS